MTNDPILCVRGVRKTFEAELAPVRALRGTDLDVTAGEFIAIMGPSGCGKTTLLNVVAGLDIADEGEIVLAGQTITGRDEDWLARMRRRDIGMVFQFFNLLEGMTVLENVALPAIIAGKRRKAAETQARDLLDLLGLGDKASEFPAVLSGGQRQRLAISRALANQPTLLLADEPTGALDTEGGREVLELFRRLHSDGQTILMVTHSNEVAAGASRIVNMRDGRVYDESQRGVRSGARRARTRGRHRRIRPSASSNAMSPGATGRTAKGSAPRGQGGVPAVSAAVYRFRATIRTDWKSLLALALLVAVAGGAVLASVGAARRTASAYAQMREATNAWDVLINPNNGSQSTLTMAQIRSVPGVAAAGRVDGAILYPSFVRSVPDAFNLPPILVADDNASYTIGRPLMISGRQPAASDPDGVWVDRTFAAAEHLKVGQTLHVDVAHAGSPPANAEPALRSRSEGRLGQRRAEQSAHRRHRGHE